MTKVFGVIRNLLCVTQANALSKASADLSSSNIGLLIKESGPKRAKQSASQDEEEHNCF